MSENEAVRQVLDAAFVVHSALGPGLLESVYEVVLAHELRKRGVAVERQRPIAIRYDGLVFEEGFRADLVVENRVIAELKSVEALLPVHAKQLLTQLRLSGLKLGLLINFGEIHLKNGIKRVANGLIEDDEVSL
jgi:GxxExxY protein